MAVKSGGGRAEGQGEERQQRRPRQSGSGGILGADGRSGGLCLDLIDLGLGLKEGSKCSIGEKAMNLFHIIN
jgi:hypothetical protein